MLNQVKALIHKYSSPELWRYLSMAAVLVGVEIVVFQLMIWGHISYLIATPASMIVGIVLNWYISRAYVFKHRPHRARKEFALVVVGSLVGIVLQLAVTSFVVEMMKAAPIIGKLLAICVTFFWNFWFRKRYVFYAPSDQTD